MTIDFEAIRSWMPLGRAAVRYLRYQLTVQGVTLHLSAGCLAQLVGDAAEIATRTQLRGEPYVECLNRHLRERARFILRWTTTHDQFAPEFREPVKIAQRFALPRPRMPECAAADLDLEQVAGRR